MQPGVVQCSNDKYNAGWTTVSVLSYAATERAGQSVAALLLHQKQQGRADQQQNNRAGSCSKAHAC
jgi:hypothetical protein